MSPVFLIGDLASKTGLSIHTLNYYLQLGLIVEVARSERSKYRMFNEDTIKALEKIIELRQQNVPIKEIIARKENGLL